MKYKLLIFDFDGTLADTFHFFLSIVNDIADRYKFNKVKKGEDELLRGLKTRDILKHLDVAMWKIPGIMAHVRHSMSENITQIKLFDGISEVLENLSKSGKVLAIASSNSYKNIQDVLGKDNISLISYFETGINLFGKSSKLEKIIKKSGVYKSNVIYIGDESRDIDAARHIGVASGIVSWGYNKPELLKTHNPDYMFNKIEEILKLID